MFILCIISSTKTFAALPKSYSIATGVSLNYFSENIGVMLDSYHFIGIPKNPKDYVLFRIGLGVNQTMPSDDTDSYSGLIGSTSIGYLYLDNYFDRLSLNRIGAGIAIDIGVINLSEFQLGGSGYLILDNFLLGIGAGVVIGMTALLTPYMKVSIGISF